MVRRLESSRPQSLIWPIQGREKDIAFIHETPRTRKEKKNVQCFKNDVNEKEYNWTQVHRCEKMNRAKISF